MGQEFGLLDKALRPMIDNARLARVFVRLAAQGVLETGRTEAEQILGNYAGDLAGYGVRAIEPGLAIDEVLSDPLVVTLEGSPGDPGAKAMRRAALNIRQGWVVIRTSKGEKSAATLAWHGITRASPILPAWTPGLSPSSRRQRSVSAPSASIGLIGGSGLYALAGLPDIRELPVETPFGVPSDAIHVGLIGERKVAFLARHGRDHRILPGEINYRANIYALKSLGVERLFSASAVGSMKPGIRPRDVVLPDQFIDRTSGRRATFFGDGLAAHVAFADPVCHEARGVLLDAARAAGATAHDGGTYLCMEGPAFSTRAESRLYRSWGVDVIGMTNLTEAKLAREAEICYATLALVTDYDCWHDDEDDVTVTGVLENLRANAEGAAAILRRAVLALPPLRQSCACGDALRHAIITPAAAISPETRLYLRILLAKYLSD
jgi:5'-methylthioadenosine phosphorylase